MLKERIAQLDKQLAEWQGKQAFLAKRVRKWYDEFQGAQCKVRVLKAKLSRARLGSPSDLNLRATPSS